MKFVSPDWCRRRWLSFYETIRNLFSVDMGILLVVMQLGITGLRKIRLVYLLDLFQGRGENGQCDFV